MFKQEPRRVDILLWHLLFGMFEISNQSKEISRLSANFIVLTSVKYAKARGNGICAEISLIGHFMQIFNIFEDAFSIKSIDVSHNLASKSYCNVSKFKLVLPR